MNSMQWTQGRPAPIFTDRLDGVDVVKKLLAEGRQPERAAEAAAAQAPSRRRHDAQLRRGRDAADARGAHQRRGLDEGAARRRRRSVRHAARPHHHADDCRRPRLRRRCAARRSASWCRRRKAPSRRCTLLLERGVDVNAFNTAGQTALHGAVGPRRAGRAAAGRRAARRSSRTRRGSRRSTSRCGAGRPRRPRRRGARRRRGHPAQARAGRRAEGPSARAVAPHDRPMAVTDRGRRRLAAAAIVWAAASVAACSGERSSEAASRAGGGPGVRVPPPRSSRGRAIGLPAAGRGAPDDHARRDRRSRPRRPGRRPRLRRVPQPGRVGAPVAARHLHRADDRAACRPRRTSKPWTSIATAISICWWPRSASCIPTTPASAPSWCSRTTAASASRPARWWTAWRASPTRAPRISTPTAISTSSVAGFGYDDGETSWLENTGGWRFTPHVLQRLSGGINTVPADFDGDGRPGHLVSLISQEWEEIWAFVNARRRALHAAARLGRHQSRLRLELALGRRSRIATATPISCTPTATRSSTRRRTAVPGRACSGSRTAASSASSCTGWSSLQGATSPRGGGSRRRRRPRRAAGDRRTTTGTIPRAASLLWLENDGMHAVHAARRRAVADASQHGGRRRPRRRRPARRGDRRHAHQRGRTIAWGALRSGRAPEVRWVR